MFFSGLFRPVGIVPTWVGIVPTWVGIVPALAADQITVGCPLSTAFLYGWDAERGVKLAVEEINAQGGVNVGGKKMPFKVEVIDTRDLEPGVPVSDALMAVEKLILEKKADFLIGGPVRSEAALAAMDLLGKYKRVSILTTGVLTPDTMPGWLKSTTNSSTVSASTVKPDSSSKRSWPASASSRKRRVSTKCSSWSRTWLMREAEEKS